MQAQAKNRYERLANEISEYVQAHLEREIKIDDLANQFGVSKYHLNRLFQATTGFQLGEFIQRRRLQQAHTLLSSGTCSVIDVSLSVGYESHSAFSRAFVKAFGCTPNDVKLGEAARWKTPNTLKNINKRDANLEPEWIDQADQIICRGLYGTGFENHSYQALAESLLIELAERFLQAQVTQIPQRIIGVSLDSPWQGEQTQSHFFMGFNAVNIPQHIVLEEYIWTAGIWARFRHVGAYSSMWQTISRIYADWVIPEGIELRDDEIVQIYVNNPKQTPAEQLITELYFPVKSPVA